MATALTVLNRVSWVSTNQNKQPLRPTRYTRQKKVTSHHRQLSQLTSCLFDQQNIPDRIVDSYVDDYDIFYVHNIIMCKLEHEKAEIPVLQKKIQKLEQDLAAPLKIVDRNRLSEDLRVTQTQLQEIQHETRKKRYLQESEEWLDQYQRIGPAITVKSFLETSDESSHQKDERYYDRLRVIHHYLEIAKKYIPINVVRIIPNDRSCPGCGQELILADPEDYTLERCPECGFERINFVYFSFYKESGGKIKNINNSDYEDLKNFLKALECYLGEQPPPTNELFQALDNWAVSYGHPPKEQISQLPLNEDGTRGEYNKSMLLQALSDIGYADYYRDYKLIGHLQWNWQLPTIRQQDRDVIISDYINTQKIFNQIPKERKSSINTQYRLYRHLEARGHPVNPTDFKLPSTPEIIQEYDEYWREMIKVIPNAIFKSLK